MIEHLVSDSSLWALLIAQSTGCIAAGLAASYLLRRHPARAHQVLLIALATSVFMPASYVLVRHFELGVLPFETPGVPQADTTPLLIAATPPVDSSVMVVDADPVAAEPLAEEPLAEEPPAVGATTLQSLSLPWATILLASWAACSTALLGRIVLQFALGRRLLRASEPLETASVHDALETARARLGVDQPVTIACNPTIQSPVIWCWSRTPVLLVQRLGQASWDAANWVGVFCHELAHFKRSDHLSGLFAELLTAAFPWHPLSWWSRERLARLSEEACDDWVLAGGQTPLDYAESLLHLSPQKRLTFLPTVVGKETAMKARIYRIVKDQCNDPRIGRQWALALCLLVVLTTTTVALAQRQRAPRESFERPRSVERDERREPPQAPALAGRRNVLERMLDQLVAQAEETEAALQERGDRSGEETEILRSELRTLRDQISIVERQLQALNRQGPRPAFPPRPTVEPSRPRGGERILEDLRNRQEEIQARLEEIGDPDNEEARELRGQLERTQREIEQVAIRINTAREQARRARDDRESAERARELSNHLRELQAEVAENQRRLERMDDPDSEAGLDRRRSIENMRLEMATIEEQLQQIRRERQDRTADRQQRLRREMDARGNPLRRQIAATERALREREERGQGDSDEANELRQVLRRLHEQLQSTEETDRPMREQRATGGRDVRSQRQLDPMEPYGQSLSPDGVARRGRATIQQGPYGGQGDPYGAAPSAERPDRPNVQRQVEELRGQVDGLNAQMQEMREMLQQLLQRRNEQNVETQEMKEY